ncbi:MAG: (Fe-S)-binding protein [bacterium]
MAHSGTDLPAAPLRVSLFVTCLADSLFPRTGEATVRVLERLGCEVAFPREQTCCGQMHRNTGYDREASILAERWQRVFADADAIVSPSASCVVTLRETLGDEIPLYELTEFLTDRLGVEDVGAHYPRRVAYHPTCHSIRVLGVGDRATRLLRAVRGLDLVKIPREQECCGFGGTFAVKNPAVSEAMGSDKLAAVESTGAEVITALDDSCLMHLGGMLDRRRSPTQTVHIAEILGTIEGAEGP